MSIAVLASSDVARALALAARWRGGGDGSADVVTVVLLDAAAAAARPGSRFAEAVAAAVAAGAHVAAHDDALRRRGLGEGPLVEGVKVVDLDEVADLVAEGAQRVMWL